MNTSGKKALSLQTGVLLIVCWCAIILLISNFSRLGFSGWFSFLFVPVCVAVVYFFETAHKPLKNDSSTIGIPLYYSFLFLFLSIAINAAYIFVGLQNFAPYVIAADIILLAIYIGIVLFASFYQRKLPAKIRKVQNNTSFSSTVSRSIGVLLAETSESDIHKALVDLKEKVDYSTNTSQYAVDETEILSKLDELQDAIRSSKSKDEILNTISKIETLWKARNTKL